MTTSLSPFEDSEDFFAPTRMSLGDHIEELRTALWRAMKGFLVALIIGFFLAKPATDFIVRPIERELLVYHKERLEEKKKELQDQLDAGIGPLIGLNDQKIVAFEFSRKELAEAVGMKSHEFSDEDRVTLKVLWKPAEIARSLDEALYQLVGRPPTLSALNITEAFMVWVKVGLYCGLILASPWIFFQIWMFVSAGLYPHEKKLVHYYLPLSLGLFLGGVLLCEFFVLPIGIKYLLSFNKWMNIEPDLRLNEWLSFAILMPLVFGIAFQLPLVMYFLDRSGILSVEFYISQWRISIFVILILAGLLSVSADPFSMMAMAVPLWILYFLGIWLCKLNPRPTPDLEVPDPEEMVEV
jgi:sec-independent protein translocase protein TatC